MNEIGNDQETIKNPSLLEIDWKVLSHKKNMMLAGQQLRLIKMNNDLNTVLTPIYKAQII